MLKAWKSYWAFTGTGYKMVTFLMVPLVVFAMSLTLTLMNPVLFPVVVILVFVTLWFAEPMIDHWFMGGMYKKNNGSLEFLQSSNQFCDFMKKVVTVDIIRRALTFLGMYAIVCVIGFANCAEVEMVKNPYVALSFLPFLSMVVSQIEVLIGRHFDMWNQRYFVVLVGFTLQGVTLSGLIHLFSTARMEMVWLMNGVFLLLFVAVAIGTVVYTKKVVRESYYDK